MVIKISALKSNQKEVLGSVKTATTFDSHRIIYTYKDKSMSGLLANIIKRGFSTVSASGVKEFVREKPITEFIPKGLEKLKQKEKVIINTK